ncbi:MAG: prepilin peptidase [Pseudomonadales bacterium]
MLENNIYLLGCATLLGLLVGSFLNVVIYRVPVMLQRTWRMECAYLLEDEALLKEEQKKPAFNLVKPDSTCPHCGHAIKPWENIPVISYLLQRGKCTSCKGHISVRYPLIEITTAIISGAVAWKFGYGLETLFGLVFSWCLISLTMIDADHQLLPDNITLPLLWLGLVANSFGLFTDLQSAVIGAISGYLVLWLVYWGFKLITGKEGMGYGDFKLLAAFGAWLGWQMLPLIVLLSSIVGAALGSAMLLRSKANRGTPIPFGPYLAVAGWIALIWGETIVQAYLKFSGVS